MVQSNSTRMLRILLAWAVVLLFVFPLYYWITVAFKDAREIFDTPPNVWIFSPTMKNFEEVFGISFGFVTQQEVLPGGGNFYIFKQTTPEERKAAMRLIKFLTQPERTAEWSMKTGYLGTRPDAYKTDALMTYVKEFPAAAVARDQLEFATAELSTYQTGRVRKLLDDAIQADRKSVV